MVSVNKWFILGGYSILVMSTQMLWLTFAPITTQSASLMNTTVDLVSDLSLVFPLTYIIFAFPMARWLDRNFNVAIATGASLTGIGSLLRLASPYSFDWQLFSQIVISLGQPLVLSSINIFAVRYFEPSQRPIAISIGSVAIFVGIIVASGVGLLLYQAGGFVFTLEIEAIPGIISMIWLLPIVLRERRTAPQAEPLTRGSWLFRGDPFMWKLAILLFVGMGIYDAIATWLQPIMSFYGLGNSAGDVVAVMTLTGIFGAAILPQIGTSRDIRRSLLLVIMVFTFFALLAITLFHSEFWIFGWMAADGFLLLAGLPVLLEWAEVHTGPERQGAANGLLMWAGNFGGLVMIFITQLLISSALYPMIEMLATAVIALTLCFTLPGRADKLSARKRSVEQKQD